MKFRTGYDFSFGKRGDIDFGDEPSLTIQSAKEECDINLIIDRAQRGMIPSHLNPNPPQYQDVSSLSDYQTALNTVITAQANFDSLPAKIQDRFSNDPSRLISFLSDPNNKAEAQSLGLVNPDPTSPPPPTNQDKTSAQASAKAAESA